MLFIRALNECTKYNSSLCLLVCRKARVKNWLQQAHASWKTDQNNLPLSNVKMLGSEGNIVPSQRRSLSVGTLALEAVDDGVKEQQPRSVLLASDPKSLKGECSGLVGKPSILLLLFYHCFDVCRCTHWHLPHPSVSVGSIRGSIWQQSDEGHDCHL